LDSDIKGADVGRVGQTDGRDANPEALGMVSTRRRRRRASIDSYIGVLCLEKQEKNVF
jgi:hypothetical protein